MIDRDADGNGIYVTVVDDGKVLTNERGVYGDPKTMGEVAAEVEAELGIVDDHSSSPLPRPKPSATRLAFAARGHVINNAQSFVRGWPSAPHRPTAQ